jgi:phosphoacetylglucosamine mutase
MNEGQYSHCELWRLLHKYPLPLVDADSSSGPPQRQRYDYGTAGFRYAHELLPPVMVRVGIVAALRSLQWTMSGEKSSTEPVAVGVMITASHNDESYNGVKCIDPDGGMMNQIGEQLAVAYVNFGASPEEDQATALIDKLKQDLIPVLANPSATLGMVHIGFDTREHSPALAALVMRAIRSVAEVVAGVNSDIKVLDHGIVTTPQLHHIVKHDNAVRMRTALPSLIPTATGLSGYYRLIVQAYLSMLQTADHNGSDLSVPTLRVDCACGVGYQHVQHVIQLIRQQQACRRKIIAFNGPGQGPLNEQCGSEHVQKSQCPPTWYGSGQNDDEDDSFDYCASLDGDADRIVFFRYDTNGPNCSCNQFQLFDGDKMSCLIADFICAELQVLEGFLTTTSKLQLGVVQTAYANGASTQFLRQRMEASSYDPVVIAKTGVKYVHHAAAESFDVAIYFESNGHGTVLFGSEFYTYMSLVEERIVHSTTAAVSPIPRRVLCAMSRLRLLPSLINQAVGDAISDLLVVDAILCLKGNWGLRDWSQNFYQDFPSRQCKVKVQNRSIITVNQNETRCITPPTVQPALDQAVSSVSATGRAFVRPSGTEDVVRIYAEASTQESADQLALIAANIVYRECHGIGDLPVFPSQPPSSKM